MKTDHLLGAPPCVRERPILFSGPMVKQIIYRKKFQTRRTNGLELVNASPDDWTFSRVMTEEVGDRSLAVFTKGGRIITIPCRYGLPGHHLWVRENYCFREFCEASGIDDWFANVSYEADGSHRTIYQCDAPSDVGFWPGAAIRKYEGKNRPSIFMYRWISRLSLQITDIRVERLQNISSQDAIDEGLLSVMDGTGTLKWRGDWETETRIMPIDAYQDIWESINGPESWRANPWVWAITFKVVQ